MVCAVKVNNVVVGARGREVTIDRSTPMFVRLGSSVYCELVLKAFPLDRNTAHHNILLIV